MVLFFQTIASVVPGWSSQASWIVFLFSSAKSTGFAADPHPRLRAAGQANGTL
jgi:hypothetical protein